MDLSDLQGKWTIRSVNVTDNPGVTQSDVLQFMPATSDPSAVTITCANPNQPNQWADWATSCVFTPEGLTGVTARGQSFLITLNPDATTKQLTCQFVDTSSQQRRLRAAGLSSFLGALIGAVAGFAAGFPLVGALIGFATALTGSAVTAASTASLDSRYTSTGTWVADDGSNAPRANKPQPLKAVSA